MIDRIDNSTETIASHWTVWPLYVAPWAWFVRICHSLHRFVEVAMVVPSVANTMRN